MDEDDFDALETVEQLPQRRMKSGFAYAMDACGLSTEEAMAYLGQSRSAIEKKRAGGLPMTATDGHRLSGLWHRIRSGDVRDMPDGPFGMAVTMRVLSGRRMPEAAKRGRPRTVPVG